MAQPCCPHWDRCWLPRIVLRVGSGGKALETQGAPYAFRGRACACRASLHPPPTSLFQALSRLRRSVLAWERDQGHSGESLGSASGVAHGAGLALSHLRFLPQLGMFFSPHLASEQSLFAEQPVLAPCSSGTRGAVLTWLRECCGKVPVGPWQWPGSASTGWCVTEQCQPLSCCRGEGQHRLRPPAQPSRELRPGGRGARSR